MVSKALYDSRSVGLMKLPARIVQQPVDFAKLSDGLGNDILDLHRIPHIALDGQHNTARFGHEFLRRFVDNRLPTAANGDVGSKLKQNIG